MKFRIGHGYDIHRFADGRTLVLGGVTVPGARGLEGHSDADVLLHALIDALLGACGRPDIGVRFPNTDDRWRGVSSLVLLDDVWAELRAEGWQIQNIDMTIVAQTPKLQPHIPEMRAIISKRLGIDDVQCTIKATTPEHLGSLGRNEGICAWSVALLALS